MMQRLKNQRGTTLVELIVCMVLLALFTLAAVTLIEPSARAYIDIQKQTRAQNLADALIETIRGEVMDANGYIRFTNGAASSDTADSVFATQADYTKGTALEFSVYPNHIELIDKDCVPVMYKADGTALLTDTQAADLDGYLHMRYYRDSKNDKGRYGNPQYQKTDESGNKMQSIAYAYTTAYPKADYMGLHISDLQFAVRSWEQGTAADTPRITAMTVVITIADSENNPLCTQRAIVPLPGAPTILYEPGTWDGKPASES